MYRARARSRHGERFVHSLSRTRMVFERAILVELFAIVVLLFADFSTAPGILPWIGLLVGVGGVTYGLGGLSA